MDYQLDDIGDVFRQELENCPPERLKECIGMILDAMRTKPPKRKNWDDDTRLHPQHSQKYTHTTLKDRYVIEAEHPRNPGAPTKILSIINERRRCRNEFDMTLGTLNWELERYFTEPDHQGKAYIAELAHEFTLGKRGRGGRQHELDIGLDKCRRVLIELFRRSSPKTIMKTLKGTLWEIQMSSIKRWLEAEGDDWKLQLINSLVSILRLQI